MFEKRQHCSACVDVRQFDNVTLGVRGDGGGMRMRRGKEVDRSGVAEQSAI